MKDRKISSKRIRNLLRGKFTPVNFSEGLFRKKIKELENLEDKRDVVIFTDEKDKRYYYPKRELRKVIRNFKRREFEVETPPAEKQASLSLVPTANAQVAEAEIKTPPLPNQPDPSVAATTRIASVTNPLSSLTNLSQAQLSLLSPSEQAIAQRINRRV